MNTESVDIITQMTFCWEQSHSLLIIQSNLLGINLTFETLLTNKTQYNALKLQNLYYWTLKNETPKTPNIEKKIHKQIIRYKGKLAASRSTLPDKQKSNFEKSEGTQQKRINEGERKGGG